MDRQLLTVKGLKTHYHTYRGVARAVDGVDLSVLEGETLGLVGESGCGKSATALSIMRLIPNPPGRIVSGTITFKDKNILTIPERDMRKIRGNEISMIFQEPMTSLNPVFTIKDQLWEVLSLHRRMRGTAALEFALHMLSLVGIADPARMLSQFPHQLSGGMRQRVMIAMALCCNPSLLIADEPTTALDVTIQAQILELMKELKSEISMAVLLITHDLGIVYEMAERVAVMYAGQVVEQATRDELFAGPLHPYTRGLLESLPDTRKAGERLHVIRGNVPDLLRMPAGCRFHPRCDRSDKMCASESPELTQVNGSTSRFVRCWYPRDYA